MRVKRNIGARGSKWTAAVREAPAAAGSNARVLSGVLRLALRAQPRSGSGGFTIVELLVVIAIVAAVTAISLPAIKGIAQSHTVNSASQQLMDDLALARQYAIQNRSVVHVLFVPPGVTNMTFPVATDLAKRLMTGVYSTYAIYAERTVGDQPGQPRARYLRKWKSLPEGVFIAPREFNVLRFKDWDALTVNPLGRPFYVSSPNPSNPIMFPFPTMTNAPIELPRVTFNPRGSCVFMDADNVLRPRDEMIELTRGSILSSIDPNTGQLYFDARESPPNNSIDNYNRIRIDGLTGRASLERPQVQ